MSQPKPTLVVANTEPIVAARLCDFLHLLPKALEKIHIPEIERDEWIRVLGKHNGKHAGIADLDIPKWINSWEESGFLNVHKLTIPQATRAQSLNRLIHPESPDKPAADGSAIILARTLIDTEQAQALLADEPGLRKIAEEKEGIPVIGSLTIFIRLVENGTLQKSQAVEMAIRGKQRGIHYSKKLIQNLETTLDTTAGFLPGRFILGVTRFCS